MRPHYLNITHVQHWHRCSLHYIHCAVKFNFFGSSAYKCVCLRMEFYSALVFIRVMWFFQPPLYLQCYWLVLDCLVAWHRRLGVRNAIWLIKRSFQQYLYSFIVQFWLFSTSGHQQLMFVVWYWISELSNKQCCDCCFERWSSASRLVWLARCHKSCTCSVRPDSRSSSLCVHVWAKLTWQASNSWCILCHLAMCCWLTSISMSVLPVTVWAMSLLT